MTHYESLSDISTLIPQFAGVFKSLIKKISSTDSIIQLEKLVEGLREQMKRSKSLMERLIEKEATD